MQCNQKKGKEAAYIHRTHNIVCRTYRQTCYEKKIAIIQRSVVDDATSDEPYNESTSNV